MQLKSAVRRPLAVAVTVLLVAAQGCSGGGGTGTGTVGPAGGTVSAPGGARVSIPAGALASSTTLSLEKATTGTPAQPADVAAQGDVYALTPHGQAFASPVTVAIPFTGNADPALQLLTAQPGGTWTRVPGAKQVGSTLEGEVSHFSYFVVVKAEAAADGGGPLDGSWLVSGIVCDGGVMDLASMPATTFNFSGSTGTFINQYCTVSVSIRYPAQGQVEWVIGDSACGGIIVDGGSTSCVGTVHPATWVVSGTTLTTTETPAPLCEYYCAGGHKVSTFTRK